MPPEDRNERAKEIETAVKAADARRAADAERRADAGTDERFDKLLTSMERIAVNLEALASRADSGGGEVPSRDARPREERSGREPGQPTQTAADADADAEQEEKAALADAQARCDRVATCCGERSPPPMMGETPDDYRRRLLRPFLRYSKEFKGLDLNTVKGPAFDGIEARVYADAVTASANPEVPPGRLLERHLTDPHSGRKMIEFYGEPIAWMQNYMMPSRKVTKFFTDQDQR